MPKDDQNLGFTRVQAVAPMAPDTHGGRAKCLQRLVRLDLPVPETVALAFDTVNDIADGRMIDLKPLLRVFGDDPILSVRPSSEDADWGGPGAVLNIGINDARHASLTKSHGADVADMLYARFVETYALQVERLDPESFHVDGDQDSAARLAHALSAYEEETDEPFPQSVEVQLTHVIASMARAWQVAPAKVALD